MMPLTFVFQFNSTEGTTADTESIKLVSVRTLLLIVDHDLFFAQEKCPSVAVHDDYDTYHPVINNV